MTAVRGRVLLSLFDGDVMSNESFGLTAAALFSLVTFSHYATRTGPAANSTNEGIQSSR